MLKAVEASRREGKFEDAGDRLLTQAENLALDSAANVQVQLRENPSRVFYGSDRLRPNSGAFAVLFGLPDLQFCLDLLRAGE